MTLEQTAFRHVHTLPVGTNFRLLANGDIVVCGRDVEPYIVRQEDGGIEKLELAMTMTPRIDKPSLLTNRKDEPSFPHQLLPGKITYAAGELVPIYKQHRQPGPAGALKPVEQKETK